MFEILLSGYRLPRANYRGVVANFLSLDPKCFYMHGLRNTYMVQDEKSIHFRVLGGTYLSHDEKSTHFRGVSGTLVYRDPQFNRHALVTSSYITEDRQSFTLQGVNGNLIISDGNTDLFVSSISSNYAVYEELATIGFISIKENIGYQSNGIASVVSVGNVAVPTIEDHTSRIVGAVALSAISDKKPGFGIVCTGSECAKKDLLTQAASMNVYAQVAEHSPILQSAGIAYLLGVAVLQNTSAKKIF